ncbi:hypothetical protein PG984_003464 [Apiospora sp. TS-2023a]
MAVQLAVQTPVEAAPEATPPICPSREASPFLRLPREIRDMIYSIVVTVDQTFESEDEHTYQGYENVMTHIGKFRLNRQIWGEVWEHLVKSNVWVQVTMTKHSPLVEHFRYDASWYPYLQLPSSRAPLETRRLLAESVAIGFSAGQSWVANWPNFRVDHRVDHRISAPLATVFFVYHPLTYGAFISALAHARHHGFAVKPSQATLACKKRFNKLVAPLCLLQAEGKAKLSGVERTALQPIQEAMNRPSFNHLSMAEIVRNRVHYRDQGRTAELRGHFSDAMCYYWLGTTKERSPRNFFPEATPEYNSLSALDTELRIGFSRSAHKRGESL